MLGRSLLNILKTLLILTWLIILCGCGQISFLPGSGLFEIKVNDLSSAGQSYGYPVSFLNDRARDITGGTAVNVPEFVVPGGLTGEGQIVAVADSGLDTGSMDDIHPDLKSMPGKMPKIVLLKSWAGREVPDDPDGHGTHMAATIAGTGAASNGKFCGVAPGASIYFQAILNSEGKPEPPANLADLFFPAYSAGARVHVNGWGGGPDKYLEPASQVDDFVRSHPDFLVIFGSGNSGPLASTITGEANSKNALAVGASILPRPAFVPGEGDTTAPAEFSSRGPTVDGRIKPELLAPASAVISARSRLVEGNLPGYNDYTRLQGTSMAAAVAGGSAVLVREYFKKYMDIDTPSAALVKAVLINGARPAEGGPSRDGFGTIDLAGTIIALKDNTFSLADEWAGVSQGEELTYTFHVDGSNAPFRATLTWTDPPAESGSAKTLVNDLDLIVRTPDGRIYYGNHFLGANAPDRTNNVEQVFLSSPETGDYTVTVSGSAVRRNTVQGSSAFLQDFALVWGQTPAEGSVERADGSTVKLAGGATFNLAGTSVVNLVNDDLAPADAGHIFPGAAVFQTPKRVYLAARLWREIGIKVLKTLEGTIFTEINPASRLGGYSLAPDTGEIMLNKSMTLSESIPPGVEISAVINPRDQRLRQVQAVYTERTGVISDIREEKGHKVLYLAGGGSFRISPEAAYSYEDSYANADKEDTPFGTGALEQLEDVLPGLPVLLRLAPSSGEIQYLAVKRRVALGTVREIKTSEGEILLENGAYYKVLPGAPVKRDGQFSSFEAVQPGDHITAVILPDTGETIGLVVFSSVIYGKAIDFARKNGVIYFLDDDGVYRSLYLADDAIIYRWGIRTTADAIAAGSRIRVTTDPGGKIVWQLDIAETVYNKGILKSLDESAGIVSTVGGSQYGISGLTRFYKNNYPVTPDDLRPGEYVELEYTTAPQPTGSVLVSANASSVALPPVFQASVIPLQDHLVVTGKAGINTTIYVWEGNSCHQVPADESGRFYITLNPERQESSFTLVALDRRTGGVTGERVPPLKDGWNVKNDNVSLTRAEAADMLARLLNWSKSSEWALTFTDKEEIPAPYRPAVAEACARGILKGYPDGSFRPTDTLSRAEAAVIYTGALRDLGLDLITNATAPYSDADEIPHWAASAAAEADAAGFFPERRGGTFAPGEQVTGGEVAAVLKRLLEYCKKHL
jgi:subtilisin family serine protease